MNKLSIGALSAMLTSGVTLLIGTLVIKPSARAINEKAADLFRIQGYEAFAFVVDARVFVLSLLGLLGIALAAFKVLNRDGA